MKVQSTVTGKCYETDECVFIVNPLQVYKYLINGYKGIKLIDFEDEKNNEYNVVTELTYKNGEDEFRPDVIMLINGMPLGFLEVKKPNNREGILAERNRINESRIKSN